MYSFFNFFEVWKYHNFWKYHKYLKISQNIWKYHKIFKNITKKIKYRKIFDNIAKPFELTSAIRWWSSRDWFYRIRLMTHCRHTTKTHTALTHTRTTKPMRWVEQVPNLCRDTRGLFSDNTCSQLSCYRMPDGGCETTTYQLIVHHDATSYLLSLPLLLLNVGSQFYWTAFQDAQCTLQATNLSNFTIQQATNLSNFTMLQTYRTSRCYKLPIVAEHSVLSKPVLL